MTWHCWGTGEYTNGAGQERGYCAGIDTSGDQIIDIGVVDKHAPDAKTFTGTDTWSGGTGNYAGISGGGKFACHPGDFKPATQGTYFLHCTVEWSYKLP